jgi:general secretion pathway protein E
MSVEGGAAAVHDGLVPAIAPSTLDDPAPSPEFMASISHEFARRHLVLSLGEADGIEHLAVAAATSPAVIFNVGVRLGRSISEQTASAEQLAAAIDRIYLKASDDQRSSEHGQSADLIPKVTVGGSDNVEGDLALALRDAQQNADSDLLNVHGKAPTIRLVDLLIFEALLRGASDVHIQPLRGKTLVRYRLDGVLHTVRELPGSLAAGVVSRIKVMAHLDVAERRAPQDGRAGVTIGTESGDQAGRRVDLRISTLPSTYGERVVIRLLDPKGSSHLLNFGALGMPEEMERKYKLNVSKTSGIVLSTGPTGSGKTTTLYTTLAWVTTTNAGGSARGCELNIMTVEDPVEYDLSVTGLAVSQTQVDPKKGLNFASGLRHILRQDPDVIMVGEVRDDETARIAVQASLTGHLVLSTLHTNDAASAIARLIDLGVEPFLVSSSLSAVLAQRLVRTLHRDCDGVGCNLCLSTGYKGRTGVFELLTLDGELKDLVGRRVAATEIKTMAQRKGMQTLKEMGEDLVRRRITSREEVGRVIEAIDEQE